jgi:hypothetical protein
MEINPGDLVRVEHQSDFPVAVVKQVDEIGVTIKYLCDGLRTKADQLTVKKGDISVVDPHRLRAVGLSESWWREQLEKEQI